ncbi:MAG: PTS glucose transporter subunit IIA [Succinivibrio sp.]
MFFRSKGDPILAPLSGEVIEISDVQSPIFAGKVVGDGVAIVPTDSIAKSPVSGVVSFIGDQKHSYGITSYDGVEILIHLGIGTVALNGEGFESLVQKGEQVVAGQPICQVDWDLIKSRNMDVTSPVIITSSSMENVKRLTITQGKCQSGVTVCMRYVNK